MHPPHTSPCSWPEHIVDYRTAPSKCRWDIEGIPLPALPDERGREGCRLTGRGGRGQVR